MEDIIETLPFSKIVRIKKDIENDARSLIYLNETCMAGYRQILDSTCKAVYTKERGWGVSAIKPLEAFSVVGFYHGAFYSTEDELEEAIEQYGEQNVSTYLFGTQSKEINISGYKHGNVLALVNSADFETIDPKITNNLTVLVVEDVLNLYVTTRNIKAGEQLFMPYGDKFYKKS